MTNHKFLFTWEEAYLLDTELRKRKQAFLEKYGEQGLFEFRSNDLDLAVITNTIMSWGMFTTKKLVIIHGVPKDSTPSNKVLASKTAPVEEYLTTQRERIPTDTVLILVSYKPDKRTKSYKFFSKHADLKAYKPLNDDQLAWFVSHELGDLIDGRLANGMVSIVGTNMYHLANECEKLKLYAQYHNISKLTEEHITTIVYAQSEINSFSILDNLFTNKEKTLALITKAQQQNQDMFQFLGMLYRWLKLVIQMIDLDEQWVKSSKEIASKLKLHPFAVAKQHKHIGKLSEHKTQIHGLYHHLLRLDSSIKTGQYPSEGFWIEIKNLVYHL